MSVFTKLFRAEPSKRGFQELGAAPLAGEVGGKVRGLAALADAGFTVPPTFVLTAEGLAGLFAPGSADLLPERKAAFLEEAAALFEGRWPVIVRSSAAEEDGAGRSWPGVFESALARDLAALPGALARCLGSYTGPRAQAYRRAHGLPDPAGAGMAAAVQPFLLGSAAGVGSVYHRDRVVVELARGHNLSITGGKNAPYRFIFDLAARRAGAMNERWLDRAGHNRLVAALLRVQGTLFHNQNISVEFVLQGEALTLLQARTNPSGAPGERLVDFPGIYAKLCDMMADFGFAPRDWSILETTDLLAYHYLGRRRTRSEPMEHFRLRLHGAAAKKARELGWVDSRFALSASGDKVLSPPLDDAAKRARIQALASDGIMLIFCDDEAGRFERSERAVRSGARTFSVGFSYPLTGIDLDEWDFERRRVRRDAALRRRERLDAEERDMELVRRALAGREGRYESGLRDQVDLLLRHLRDHRRVIDEVLVEGRRDGEVAGLPFKPEPRVVQGTAVTPSGIVSARAERFVYFADDLEPSFLDHIGRMDAVVVSRGAFGSHAAALCSEFNVPLVLETRNLDAVSDGDRVAVDLASGTVTLELPGLSRARRLLAVGEAVKARAELEAQAGAADSAEGLQLLGDACRLTGGSAAEAHYRAAVRLDPRLFRPWLHLAEFALAAGRLEEAGEAVARALDLEPEVAHAHQLKAELLLAQGRPAEALAEAERAAAADPALLAARIAHAKALRAVGRREDSRAELAAILALDPKNGEAARLELELLLDVSDFAPAAELAFKKICLVGTGFVRALNGLSRDGDAAHSATLLARILDAPPPGCAFDLDFLRDASPQVLEEAAARLAAIEPDRADICEVLARHWDRAGKPEAAARLRARARGMLPQP